MDIDNNLWCNFCLDEHAQCGDGISKDINYYRLEGESRLETLNTYIELNRVNLQDIKQLRAKVAEIEADRTRLQDIKIDMECRNKNLRAKIAEIDRQLGSRNLNKEAEYLTKLAQLQLENKKLREALEVCKYD